jgi:hypothetical protein
MANQPLSRSPLHGVQKILTLLGCNSLLISGRTRGTGNLRQNGLTYNAFICV